MPRVHIYLNDIDEIEDLEDQEGWEELIGVRGSNERRDAQMASSEARGQRRSVRGSVDALARKRAERRKQVHRGGRRA